MPKRIDELTPEQRGRMKEWADKWIEIGLRTGDADRPRFEAGCQKFYEFADIPWHGNVVWVDNPLVLSFAAPIAACLIENGGGEAIGRAEFLGPGGEWFVDALAGPVRLAVAEAVGDVAGGATASADSITADTLKDAVKQNWGRYMGGQFWVGGWYWGPAYQSFFRDVCNLELPGDLWDRLHAHEETAKSACWWWPHREFVMVSERPLAIHRERIGPDGWQSHRLHNDDGPALSFRGWDIYAIHGVRVPKRVIDNDYTAQEALEEPNAEVRRVMMERMGFDRVLRESNAEAIHADEYGTLFRIPMEPEDLMLVHVISPEDKAGDEREYVLPVHPELRPMVPGENGRIEFGEPQELTAKAAVASTYGKRAEEYSEDVRT